MHALEEKIRGLKAARDECTCLEKAQVLTLCIGLPPLSREAKSLQIIAIPG